MNSCEFQPTNSGFKCSRCGREVAKPARANCKRQDPPKELTVAEANARRLEAARLSRGPGTEFRKLIQELGITEKAGCGCGAMAATMNRLGVDGCRRERTAILAQLEANAEKYTFTEKATAAWNAVRHGLPLSLGGLLDLAIERAENEIVRRCLAPPEEHEPGWQSNPDVMRAHALMLDQAAEAAKNSSPPSCAGRGIVTLGGGKHFVSAWVLISVLRNIGCDLPVEWWYLPGEMTPRELLLAGQLQNVVLRQVSGLRIIGGWQAKARAVMDSKFREVLFIDADNVPASDPSYLFDEPGYRTAGALFWPISQQGEWVKPAAISVSKISSTGWEPLETGQFIIDKSRHWPTLLVAAHLSDHSDFWYGGDRDSWHVYGDAGTFLLALERMKPGYALAPPAKFLGGSSLGAFQQHDFSGKPIFYHRIRPADKWQLHGRNDRIEGFDQSLCDEAIVALRNKSAAYYYDLGHAHLDPLWRFRIPSEALQESDRHFNPAIIEHAGRTWFAYRRHNENARICLAEVALSADSCGGQMRINWEAELDLGEGSQEDPRLFIFEKSLHVSFTRFVNGIASVAYARLSNDGRVEEIFAPELNGRQKWEKNWGFFEYDNELHAVYSIRPHKILKINGNSAEIAYEIDAELPFSHGEPRGGAAPVLWRGEWYSFFHGINGDGKERQYTCGLYTFENKPPFRPSRFIPQPLLRASLWERPAANIPHVVYPSGALHRHNSWVVSFGNYDTWCELAAWDSNYLEWNLLPVKNGPFDGIAKDDQLGNYDLWVWREVNTGNDYRLPDDMTGWTVIDIGARIGAVSRACLDRGAKTVIACEPDKWFDLLQKNAPEAECRKAYVVGRREPGLPFPDVSHLVPYVLEVSDLIAGHDRIDFLKIDCEGCEYSIFEADLSRVQNIAGEAHRITWRGTEWTIDDARRMLEQQGFSVESKQIGGDAWLFWASKSSPESPRL